MLRESAFGYTTIRDIQLHGVLHRSTKRLQVLGVSLEGQLALPTANFWQSLINEFGLPSNAPQQETAKAFEKVATVFPELRVRYRVEWDGLGNTWVTELVADSAIASEESAVASNPRLEAAMEAFVAKFGSDDPRDPQYDPGSFDPEMAEAADFTENFLADYETETTKDVSESDAPTDASKKKLPRCSTRRPLPSNCHSDDRCRSQDSLMNVRGRRYPRRTPRTSTVRRVIECHQVKVDRLGAILERLMHRSDN